MQKGKYFSCVNCKKVRFPFPRIFDFQAFSKFPFEKYLVISLGSVGEETLYFFAFGSYFIVIMVPFKDLQYFLLF